MNEPNSAGTNPAMVTSGTTLQAMRKMRTCRSRTLMAVRISDRGATNPNTNGRTKALSSAISTTTATPDRKRSTVMLGSSHAVTQKAMADTTSVISRLTSADGPPCHSHRMRNWVLQKSIGLPASHDAQYGLRSGRSSDAECLRLRGGELLVTSGCPGVKVREALQLRGH